MRMGYKITLSIITIMMLFTISIGTSYSFYAVSDTQDKPNYLATTCFDISYEDSESIKIDGTNGYAYPMSEETALAKLKPYTFTIKNKCTNETASAGINYILTLNTIKDKPKDLFPYLNYKLMLSGEAKNSNVKLDNLLYTDETIKNSIITSEVGTDIDESYNIDVNSLMPGESREYSLYLWIAEDACDNNLIIDENTNETQCEKYVMGKSFEARIALYAYM